VSVCQLSVVHHHWLQVESILWYLRSIFVSMSAPWAWERCRVSPPRFLTLSFKSVAYLQDKLTKRCLLSSSQLSFLITYSVSVIAKFATRDGPQQFYLSLPSFPVALSDRRS